MVCIYGKDLATRTTSDFSVFLYQVCELDLVFSLHKSLMILFEMFIGGMLCESNRREVLQQIVEAEELVESMTKPGEDVSSQLDDGTYLSRSKFQDSVKTPDLLTFPLL